jgi:hypothetical protein
MNMLHEFPKSVYDYVTIATSEIRILFMNMLQHDFLVKLEECS